MNSFGSRHTCHRERRIVHNSFKDFIEYTFNDKNKPITAPIIENILKKYNCDYKVSNINLFQTALTHETYTILDTFIPEARQNPNYQIIKDGYIYPLFESYERLEFLGDSLIKSILTTYLFKRFPNEKEGFMTILRARLEDTETYALLLNKLELIDYILISRNYEKNGSRAINKNIREDCFEAFFGALYLDSNENHSLVSSFFINLIEEALDMTSYIMNDTNYKNQLIVITQKLFNHSLPRFKCIGTEPLHEYPNSTYINYICVAIVNKQVMGKGKAITKVKAEQLAAKEALLHINPNYFEEQKAQFLKNNKTNKEEYICF